MSTASSQERIAVLTRTADHFRAESSKEIAVRSREQIEKRFTQQASLQRHLRALAKDVQHDPAWLSSDGLESGWSWVLEQPRTREEIEERLEVIEEIVGGLGDEQRFTFLGIRYALRWVLGLEPVKGEPHVMDDRGTWAPPHDSDYYRVRFLAEDAAEAEALVIAEAVRRKKKRREERKQAHEENALRLKVERQAELNAIGVEHA